MDESITVAVVNVVGAMGAGKTTMMSRIESRPREFVQTLADVPGFSFLHNWPSTAKIFVVREEPNNWVDGNNRSLLDLVYDEKTRKQHSYELQKTVLTDRLRSIHNQIFVLLPKMPTHVLLVTDGSIHTDHSVFARSSFESGNMTDDEWKKYDSVYETIAHQWTKDLSNMIRRSHNREVDVFQAGTLYLQTPIGELQNRVQTRGRPCEKNLPIEYIENISNRHQYLLQSATYPAQPVVQIVDTPLDESVPFVVVNKD
mgnify:CR=1 FL=1